MAGIPPFRDTTPRTLTAWRLINDRSGADAQKANTGTKYAEFAGHDIPKSKFLFTIKLTTSPVLRVSQGSSEMGECTFSCKTATRPNPTVNYVDINAYNFRYKVATRVDMGTVTVSFYDDNKNTAHDLVARYMAVISPIANRESGPSYYAKNDDIQDWASVGPLPESDPEGLIKTLRVTHHFSTNNTTDASNYSRVHYDYINPKIQTYTMDEFDMSSSEAPLISITFVYDSVNIVEELNGVDEEELFGTVGDLSNPDRVSLGEFEQSRGN